MTIEEISKITKSKINGDPSFIIKDIAFIKDAKEGDLVLADGEKYYKQATQSPCSAILTDKEYFKTDKILLLNNKPNEGFISLLQSVLEQNTFPTEKSSAKIPKSCKIAKNVTICDGTVLGENVTIYPNVYIGSNCKIGDNTIIYPNVCIYDRCIIGKNCILNAQVTIGADGFGYESGDNGLLKYPHIGYIEISDEVEIGANTCVDRAKLGKTYIGFGTKIDNLCQIAHNVHIGKFTVICGQTGIAGSATIGDMCILGAQVGIADHVEIADRCIIGAKSGVIKNTQPGEAYLGWHSQPVDRARRIEVLYKKLPDTHAEYREMKNKLAELDKNLKSVIKKI